jgi:hypothetical protein
MEEYAMEPDWNRRIQELAMRLRPARQFSSRSRRIADEPRRSDSARCAEVKINPAASS